MSHTASKTWVSDEAKEFERFAKIKDNYQHIAPNSPFLPRTWSEWIAHRIDLQEAAYTEGLRRLAIKKQYISMENKENMQKAFTGERFDDHLSSVLAVKSIWLPSVEAVKPDRELAPWPTNEELKHEGSYRSTSGYCRFPPLPRQPGNSTVGWRQRSPIVPFQLDEVGIPVMKRDGSEVEDEQMVSFLGEGMMDELNK